MTEPASPVTEPRRVSLAAVGSALELAAMGLVCGAGFAAPTDWNVTLGLALLAGCLFALGFFALTDKPTTTEGA
jgi:hypothetical protein